MNVTATAGGNQVTVRWSNAPSNGDAAVYNQVAYSTDNSTWTTATSTLSASTTKYAVTGLSGNTPYWFEVLSIDTDQYRSIPGVPSQSVIPGPFAPAAPTGLFVAADTNQATTLSWVNAVSNGDPTVANEVAYSTDTTAWHIATTTLAASATSYTVAGLSNGTAYWFEVIALDGLGRASTITRSAAFVIPHTTAPNPATVISVVAGTKSAVVSWTNAAYNGDATAYNEVEYSINGSTWTKSSNVGAKATSFSVTKLNSGQSYYFEVIAVDANGRESTAKRTSATTTVN
jgi:hypothetical protein